MNHTYSSTNQELLKELKKRLPDFNNDELFTLSKIVITLNPYKEEISKYFKANYPETHGLIQKANQVIEQESSIKVKVYRCQGCRNLILVHADEKPETFCSPKCSESKKNQ